MTYEEKVALFNEKELANQGFEKSEKSVDELSTRGGGENVLQDGDEFTLPDTDTPEVLQKKFGNNIAYAILVTKKNGKLIPWYFSMLRKMVVVYDPKTKERAKDENGVEVPVKNAEGDAAEAFRKAENVGEFLKANKGKTLVVESHEVVYTCVNPNQDPQYRNMWVYKIVFKK